MADRDPEHEAIASGDADAFARFLSRAEAPVRRGLASFAGDVDTEAIVQETFLRVWQVAARVEPDGKPEPLLRLAYRVARNLAVDEIRRRKRLRPGDPEDPGNHPLDEPAVDPAPPDPLLRKLIALCRDLLPPQPRAAFDARLEAGGGEPDATLAARAGMRLNTFLQNVGRARKLLAGCLRGRGVTLDGEVA